jgi:hypothetical protein
VRPDFFRLDVFEWIRVDCERQETTAFGVSGASLNQGFLRVPDVLQLLYEPALRQFLNALTGKVLVRSMGDDVVATALAQVRHYVRGSSGLMVHNDDGLGFDLGMLVYLTPNWRRGLGGETCLYRRVGGLLLEERVVLPHGNTLVLIFFSGDSWHCIREMSADWKRSNIFLGWQTTSPGEYPEEITVGERSTALSAE